METPPEVRAPHYGSLLEDSPPVAGRLTTHQIQRENPFLTPGKTRASIHAIFAIHRRTRYRRPTYGLTCHTTNAGDAPVGISNSKLPEGMHRRIELLARGAPETSQSIAVLRRPRPRLLLAHVLQVGRPGNVMDWL